MPKFISGNLKIDIKFNDRSNQYKAKLCTIRGPKECETVHVGLPGSGPTNVRGKRIAVDDPRAYRNAASAAISFSERLQDNATHNRRGSGWHVAPPKRIKRRR